jgi:translation initiation factor 2B subunit (eIF-2B alpha/beta/delta family)
MISERIAALAADRVSGASAVLARAIDILREALAGDADLTDTARALVRAQPSMAPVWNAALAALAARDDPGRFEAFAERIARAPGLLTGCALDLFGDRARANGVERRDALHIVTLSHSGSVLAVLEALHNARSVQVSCGEGRPALEGRALAERLAASGITVTCTTDAALGEALTSADAVLVGADAVTAGWFLNKVGTRMLAAAAAAEGVPLYVVASRDKFASAAVAARLSVREGAPTEVWHDPPPGVAVRNLYFERTPLDAVTGVISDVGLLGIDRVRQVCEALEREIPADMRDAPGL